MSLDASVWLVAGVGLGVAMSLMLLMAYAGLERLRLGRRLKRARVLKTVPQPRMEVVPVPASPTAAVASVESAGIGRTRQRATDVAASKARVVRMARNEHSVEPAGAMEAKPGSAPPARPELVAESKPTLEVVEPKPRPEVEPALASETPPRRRLEVVPRAEAAAKVAPVADNTAMQRVEGSSKSKPAAAPPLETAKPGSVATANSPPPAPKTEPKSVEALFAEAFARDRLVAPGDEGPKPE